MEKILCYCCNKTKNKLSLKKFEPRWVIILAGRQLGSDSVKEFIIKKRYCGADISASELLV
jgi:hypothetical protein